MNTVALAGCIHILSKSSPRGDRGKSSGPQRTDELNLKGKKRKHITQQGYIDIDNSVHENIQTKTNTTIRTATKG